MANQINGMTFSSLPVARHCDFHYQANGLMQAAGADALHIAALLPAYAEAVEMESSIVRRKTTYVSTEQLDELDKLRDYALGVIKQVVNAHETNTIQAKSTAAKTLNAKMAPYKNISRHEKGAQTREVAGLLAVLSEEVAAAHIATLGLTEEVAELTRYNAAFEAAQKDKLQEEVERLPQKDIDTDELRKQVDARYAEIIQTVNAYAIVQPTDAINSFILQMNALISLSKPGSSSGGKNDGSADSGQGGGSTDGGGTTPDPEPTPEPEPTPDPTPDTGGGGYEDENGELAG